MSNILENRYLDPTNDVAFKKLFSQKDLMMHFLNTVLNLDRKDKIVDLDYLPQEHPPVIGELKRTIVDVKVQDASKNHYIVEMQNSRVEEFIKRTEYYGSIAIVNQIETGIEYAKIEPVIVICITKNHLAIKAPDLDIVSYHKTIETKTGKCYFKNLSYVLVELERFKKNDPKQLKSTQDHWFYYLKYVQKSKEIPENLQIPELKKAYAAIERFNWTKPELDEYLKTEIYIGTERLNMAAMFEGGKKEGIKEGIKEGEKNKQLEIIKNMIAQKIPLEVISSCTGLSIDEIRDIKP